MKRRDVFKLIFSPSSIHILPERAEDVSRYPEDNNLETANKYHSAGYFANTQHSTFIVKETLIGYRRNTKALPVLKEAEKAFQLLPLQLNILNQRISLTVSLKYPTSTSLINDRSDYAFVQFGIDESVIGNCDSEARIGITRSGVAFIGKKKHVIPDADMILRGGIRLRISIWLRSGNSFTKLSCLDRYENTLCLLTTEEYSSNKWLGSVAIVSKSWDGKTRKSGAVFNNFEFNNVSI